MATAESVKAHIQSLITKSNAKTGKGDTTLTSAVRNLINGYGTGSGGGDIVYTNEPPNESSDKSKIYIVTQPSAEIHAIFSNGNHAIFNQTAGIGSIGHVRFLVYAVDNLPENMEQVVEDDVGFPTIPVYVDNLTGEAYVCFDGVVLQMEEIMMDGLPNKGWVENESQINPDIEGVYYIRKDFTSIYIANDGSFSQFEFLKTKVRYILSNTGNYYRAVIDMFAIGSYIKVLGEYNGLPVRFIPHGMVDTLTVSVIIGEGIERFEEGSFRTYYSLQTVKLPNTLKYIGSSSFAWCQSLYEVEIPRRVEEIGDFAFGGSQDLRSVTFHGTPRVIDGLAFSQCYSLENIYVPWSEGEVANAPWGATNATIHYNSTGE